VKHGSDSAVVRLDLSGEADILTILSGRESTVRRLDEIIGLTGEDPLSWMPQLLERV
jgi:type IV secretion system protein VirB4